MNFNLAESGKNAFQFASLFCFPRLAGTKGEKEAQELLKKNFENLSLLVREEEFPASYLSVNLSRFALTPMGFFILLGAFFYLWQKPEVSFHFWLALLFTLALIIGLGFAIYCQSAPVVQARNKYLTKNIFAMFGPEIPEQEVLLVAHYDSKSQIFPVWLRVAIYYLGGLYSLFVITLGLYISSIPVLYDGVAKCQGLYYPPAWFWIFLSGAIIDFLPLFNRLGNKSPGATDNAGAIGVVLELARLFKERPPQKSRIWFLFPGAEELGVLGARAFVEKHKTELDPNNTYVINFDPLGAGNQIRAFSRLGFPGKKTDRRLNQKVKALAKKSALPFQMIHFSIGFSTDAYPFLKAGYKTINLGNFNRWIHTPKDTSDKLHPQSLGNYVCIAFELIRELDQK